MKVYSQEHGYFTRLVKFDNVNNCWNYAFVYLQFKKGTTIQDKTSIKVKDSWLSFYKSKNGKIVLYIFVNDFEVVDNATDIEVVDNNK